MNLTHTNWQEVQIDLIAKFKNKACKEEYRKLENATTFEQLFSVIFMNYGWLKDHNYTVPEIENITPIQLSEFMVWLLEAYCLGKGVDTVVQTVIDLHKLRLSGTEPTEKQWDTASDAARDAARAAAWDAASDAAWNAASAAARDAASAAARNAAMNAAMNAAWDAAWDAASAAWDAAWAAARNAAWDAASAAARNAAMDAAREKITNKLITLIYNTMYTEKITLEQALMLKEKITKGEIPDVSAMIVGDKLTSITDVISNWVPKRVYDNEAYLLLNRNDYAQYIIGNKPVPEGYDYAFLLTDLARVEAGAVVSETKRTEINAAQVIWMYKNKQKTTHWQNDRQWDCFISEDLESSITDKYHILTTTYNSLPDEFKALAEPKPSMPAHFTYQNDEWLKEANKVAVEYEELKAKYNQQASEIANYLQMGTENAALKFEIIELQEKLTEALSANESQETELRAVIACYNATKPIVSGLMEVQNGFRELLSAQQQLNEAVNG